MTSRLSTLAADLSELLAAQSEDVQRAVAAQAAEWALSAAQVSDPRLDAALRQLAAGEYGASAVVQRLQSLVEELDEAAFDLQDAGDEDGYAALFNRARAASSVLFALEANAADAALEASYEAVMARDADVGGLRMLVRASLESQHRP